MNLNDRHIVKKQRLLVHMSNRSRAHDVQEAISELCQTKLAEVLEALFDELAPTDAVLRIDKLSLDVGTMTEPQLIDELGPRLEAELREQLIIQSYKANDAQQDDATKIIGEDGTDQKVAAIAANDVSDKELLIHFLSTGTLPWWKEEMAPSEMKQLVANLIEEEPHGFVSLIQEVTSNIHVSRRVFGLIPAAQIQKIVQLLQPEFAKTIAVIAADVVLLSSKGLSNTATKYHWPTQGEWLGNEHLFSLAVKLPPTEFPIGLVRLWVTQEASRVQQPTSSVYVQLLKACQESPAVATELKSEFPKIIEVLSHDFVKEQPQQTAEARRNQEILRQVTGESPSESREFTPSSPYDDRAVKAAEQLITAQQTAEAIAVNPDTTQSPEDSSIAPTDESSEYNFKQTIKDYQDLSGMKPLSAKEIAERVDDKKASESVAQADATKDNIAEISSQSDTADEAQDTASADNQPDVNPAVRPVIEFSSEGAEVLHPDNTRTPFDATKFPERKDIELPGPANDVESTDGIEKTAETKTVTEAGKAETSTSEGSDEVIPAEKAKPKGKWDNFEYFAEEGAVEDYQRSTSVDEQNAADEGQKVVSAEQEEIAPAVNKTSTDQESPEKTAQSQADSEQEQPEARSKQAAEQPPQEQEKSKHKKERKPLQIPKRSYHPQSPQSYVHPLKQREFEIAQAAKENSDKVDTDSSFYQWQQEVTVEEAYINNAGVVLLWVYLPRFFENLGFVKDGDFVNEQAQFDAVNMLHYIATGSEEIAEYDLALNKILCGMRIGQAVPTAFSLSDEEKEHCENLLLAAIKNWPMLKGTSPEGLRQAFLMRKGKISKSSGGWMIRVEQATPDILINYLPWSIGIIKLPWTTKLIYTEWKTQF
jgi:hypothetical protein